MSKQMVLPKIIKLGKRHGNGNPNFTDGTLNDWSVSNAQYEQLTKRQQRMVIAADVVALLDSRKIWAMHGRYLRFSADIRELSDIVNALPKERGMVDGRAMMRKVMKKQRACSVCAMGSVFLASLERVNTLKVSARASEWEYAAAESDLRRAASSTDFVARKGPFTADQQRVMERCFEDTSTWNPSMVGAQRRIRSIMMNIISNKGVLKIYARAPVLNAFAASVAVKDVRW